MFLLPMWNGSKGSLCHSCHRDLRQSEMRIDPKEIVGKNLPIDPDTSHRFPERIFRVIDTNHDQGIVVVHLSQLRGEGKENLSRLPVETYGIVVLQALRAKYWSAT